MADDRPPGVLSQIVGNVQDELEIRRRQDAWRKMTPAQRKKARADAQRSKQTYDLPPEVIQAVREWAAREDISQSDLVTELLIRALNAHRAGQLDIDNDRLPAKSLRWLWKLVFTEFDAGS